VITRIDIARYLNTLITVYIILIFIRIVMSWFTRVPYNPTLNAILSFVSDVTDPYLNLFRRFIPAVRIGPGALDLSPMVATFVLIIVGGLVTDLIAG
jgi:YggT family protein